MMRRCDCRPPSLVLVLSVAISLGGVAACAAQQKNEDRPAGAGDDRPARGGRGGFFGGITFNFGGEGGQPRRADPVKDVTNNGPQIPDSVSMSEFSVLGFCKGNWPFVIEYEVGKPCQCWIEASSDTADFYYRLDGSKQGRQLVVFNIPERFGNKPNLTRFVVRALEDGLQEVGPGPLRIFGIGCGPNAVGSVTIDQLTFQPSNIKVKQKEIASYSFHSLRDFPRVAVEFCQLSVVGGEVRMKLVKKVKVDGGLKRDQTFGVDKPKTWDGKGDKNRVSTGLHLLQVRVWTNPANDGSWLVATSGDQVEVREE